MSRDDTDLLAVRDLPPGLPEPTDDSVLRTWHQITSRRATQSRPLARPLARLRLLVPVAAAAVVIGLASGVALLLDPDRGGPALRPGAIPMLGGPIEVAEAMERLIDRAGRIDPTPMDSGEVIYVQSDGVAARLDADGHSGVLEAERHQMWLDPQGMIPLKIMRNSSPMEKRAGRVERVAEARTRLAAQGPSLDMPTAQWLAALPTDPAALRAYLFSESGAHVPDGEHRLMTVVGDLLWLVEPVLTAPVRVAFYQMLAGFEGLSATEIIIDGRTLYAIRHVEVNSAVDLLFDPATGRSAGRRSAVLGDEVRISPALGVDPAEFDPTILSQSVWIHRSVAGVGKTG